MAKPVKAKKSDLACIMELFEKCRKRLSEQGINQWDDLYPGGLLEEDIASGSMYKYTDREKIIAVVTIDEMPEKEYGQVVWEDTEGKVLVVHRLAVEPKYQGKGVASELMEFVESYATQNGYTSIRVDAYLGNPAAVNLYIKRGYRRAGQVFFPRRKLPFECFEKGLAKE